MVVVWLVFSLCFVLLRFVAYDSWWGICVSCVCALLCWVSFIGVLHGGCLVLHGPNLGICVLHGPNLGGLCCIWCCDLLRWVSLTGVLC